MTADPNATTEWRLDRVLTGTAVEGWIAALPTATKRVVLRLGSWERSGPFADARLQAALCILHRNGIATAVEVPSLTLSGDRADRAFADPDPLAKTTPLTPTERTLAGSVAGLAIGQLCRFDEEHTHIADLQRRNLARRRFLYGWGAEMALAVPTELEPTGFPRRPAIVREATFNNRLEDLLGPLGVSVRNARRPVLRWFDELKTFAFEASENTWDHGRLNFQMRPIPSVRFVRLRRIDLGPHPRQIEDATPGFEEPFEQYLASLSAARQLPVPWAPSRRRLVEITIADGGVGIAANMARGFHVFEGPIEQEAQHLVEALLPDGTTKSPGEAGRGQGFRKMLQACYRLSGMTVVRTGRLRATRSYRRLDGTNERVDFNDPHSAAYTPIISQTPLPLLAGTSVSLIFPIDRSSSRRTRPA